MNIAQELERIQQTVTSWDEVQAAPHRFGGVEFQVGNVEVGHVHRNGMIDIPFTRKIRAALLEEHLAEPHHLLPDTGWISYYLGRTGDTDKAISLFRLSYLQKRRRRINGLDDAIAQLDIPARVKDEAFGAMEEIAED